MSATLTIHLDSKTPITDSLRGTVKLPPGFDERAALTEELLNKHGVQG